MSVSDGTNEDDSQSDPHPEASILHDQTTLNFGPGESSASTSSGKQKKNCSASEQHFQRESTPAMIEANQFSFAFSSLQATIFLQISITTSTEFPIFLNRSRARMPTFDGKSENFELFVDDFLQTSLRNFIQLT